MKLKRISAILLVVFFFISNSGMAITLHYCDGEISSINFFSTERQKCDCGEKAMKSSCCKDKTTIFKAKIDNAKINYFTFKSTHLKLIFKPFNQNVLALETQLNYTVSDFYLPPQFKPKVPIYLLDRVFLI